MVLKRQKLFIYIQKNLEPKGKARIGTNTQN